MKDSGSWLNKQAAEALRRARALPVSSTEQRTQSIAHFLERKGLRQHVGRRKTRVDATLPVTRCKYKRHTTINQRVRNRIAKLTAELDVEDRTIRRVIYKSKGCLDVPRGTECFVPKLPEQILQQKGDKRLILYNKNTRHHLTPAICETYRSSRAAASRSDA